MKSHRLVSLSLLVFSVLFFSLAPGMAYAQPKPSDLKEIVGPEECAECHKQTNEAWLGTHHYKTFQELTRREKAREIAKNLGIKRIKNQSTCTECHFTSIIENNRPKVIAGISCEKCHGPGKNYIKIHSDYGGKKVTRETETPAHRKERWAKSEAAGMIRPGNLYALAKNCYECHTVPKEELVNKGGHKAGSDFELVSWSQGEVRHNVWYDTKTNKEASPERRRMMYVVGQMVDLEQALRGLGKATVAQKYAKSFVFRYKRALKGLEAIAAQKPIPEVTEAIAVAKSVKIKLNSEAEMEAAAKRISRIAQKFASTYDGKDFGALDSLIPPPSAYKGKVYEVKK